MPVCLALTHTQRAEVAARRGGRTCPAGRSSHRTGGASGWPRRARRRATGPTVVVLESVTSAAALPPTQLADARSLQVVASSIDEARHRSINTSTRRVRHSRICGRLPHMYSAVVRKYSNVPLITTSQHNRQHHRASSHDGKIPGDAASWIFLTNGVSGGSSVGLSGWESVAEGDGECVECGFPPHRPPGLAGAGGVEGPGNQIQAL